MEFLIQADTWLLLRINGFHSPFLDSAFTLISDRLTWVPLYAVLLFALARKEQKRIWIPLLCIIGMTVLSDQLASTVFKPLISRPRPCHLEELKTMIHLVKDYCGGAYGFYSSHASNTFALFVFWGYRTGKPLGVILGLYALLNSYSRIYLGVHYPSDVLAGMLAGLVCSRIFLIFEEGLRRLKF
jgi:undecaprenyl-diphosphatase